MQRRVDAARVADEAHRARVVDVVAAQEGARALVGRRRAAPRASGPSRCAGRARAARGRRAGRWRSRRSCGRSGSARSRSRHRARSGSRRARGCSCRAAPRSVPISPIGVTLPTSVAGEVPARPRRGRRRTRGRRSAAPAAASAGSNRPGKTSAKRGGSAISSQSSMRFERLAVEDRRRGAGAEGGGAVALADLGVVAVPVQLHPLLRPLQEDRGEVDDADALALGQVARSPSSAAPSPG